MGDARRMGSVRRRRGLQAREERSRQPGLQLVNTIIRGRSVLFAAMACSSGSVFDLLIPEMTV
ncbi:hypothetical protein JZ751_021024 [Albula glossodonta]|uniref:Uncharacterized protein n=1 Tax=Albula glossodonta TaxID=121402 RepID=A0A8T2PK74_9TELE|nr:hypothetical protein JZ751_021024 [Albula glossodonta]